MAHKVTMEVPKAKSVLNKDIIFEISNSKGKLGELHVSKGNIEWVRSGASVKKKRLSWEKFAEKMSAEDVKTVRKRKKILVSADDTADTQ
jgi:hypothetical protein